jgi:hypothetical protein
MTTSAACPDVAAEAEPSDLPTRAAALAAPLRGVVVDNNGYTIERARHGSGETYIDISIWDAGSGPVRWRPGRGGRDAAAVPVRAVGELRAALIAVLGRAVRSTS